MAIKKQNGTQPIPTADDEFRTVYLHFSDEGSVTIDGKLTADELREIIALLENKDSPDDQ